MQYAIYALVALYAVSEFFHRRERAQMLNRIMSKDYAQYRYFEDKWKPDLKEVEKVREEVRVASTPPPADEEPDPATDLTKYDEAWEEDEK